MFSVQVKADKVAIFKLEMLLQKCFSQESLMTLCKQILFIQRKKNTLDVE